MAGRVTRVKTIVHEHFVDPNLPIYQMPFDYFLSGSTDAAIAVSNSVLHFMIEKRYLPPDRVQVIYNGAPLKEFKPLEENLTAEEKKRFNIPNEFKIVATIGRLDEQKGNSYFLDAAAKVLKRHQKVKFMLIGDGPLMSELQLQCGARGIEDDVIFAGYCSNIPRIQSIIDVQVFPSLWEGTPLTLFEAMSMKKAIVSTDVDGLGEVLRHGKNALLVPPRDDGSLASAIATLLEDREKADSLSSQAGKDSAEYDIQRTVDRMQEVYLKVLRN
jgi:glycosyltransferase involved in cell wall biosynthesis